MTQPRMMSWVIAMVILAYAALIVHQDVWGQQVAARDARSDRLRSGAVPVMGPDQIDSLRQWLEAKDPRTLVRVRQLLFGETYTPNLADWVLYIDSLGSLHNHGLTQHNKPLDRVRPVLRGQRAVYVLAFVEEALVRSVDPRRAVEHTLSLLTADSVDRGSQCRLRRLLFSREASGAEQRTCGPAKDTLPRAARDSAIGYVLDFLTGLSYAQDTSLLRPPGHGAFTPREVSLDSVRAELLVLTDPAVERIEDRRRRIVNPVVRSRLARLFAGTWRPATDTSKGGTSEADPSQAQEDQRIRKSMLRLFDTLSTAGYVKRMQRLLGDAARERPGRTPDSLRIGLEVLHSEIDPFLVRVVTTLGTKLGATPSLSERSKLPDTTVVVPFIDLGTGSNVCADTSAHLLLAVAKFPLVDDVWGRLSIYPPRRQSRSILTNFVTTSRSPFGVSLGAGITLHPPRETFELDGNHKAKREFDTTATEPNLIVDTNLVSDKRGVTLSPHIYVMGHVRLPWWPRRPHPLNRYLIPHVVWVESVSLFAGANLAPGNLLDLPVLGMSLDRVWGSSANLAVGVAQTAAQEVDRDTRKVRDIQRYRFFLGLAFYL